MSLDKACGSCDFRFAVGVRVELRPPRKPVVLVVDDDAGVREALHLILDEDYEVADAADGGEAVNAVRTRPVDLVLLDILLPEVDGIETLKELKALAPAIPVIMLTGVRTIRTTVAAMKLGAVDYVTKPFQEEELLGLIRGAIAPERSAAGDVAQRVGAANRVPQPSPTRFSRSVNLAIGWINAKHADKLTVEGIAEAVDISASHLAHAFRVETGMTVMDFVTHVRVKAAKHLLTTTDHNLDEIAARSGFFDASHLSRMFFHSTGRRPGFYRRESR